MRIKGYNIYSVHDPRPKGCPERSGLLLVLNRSACAEAVHASAPQVVHLLIFEVVCFQHPVDVELGKLEGSLIHAFILDPSHAGVL